MDNVAVGEPVFVPEPEPQPPTFADQATNAVFGDSPDDFLFLDQPDATGKPKVMKHVESPPVYENSLQEEEMFGMPPEQGGPRVEDEPPAQTMPRMEDELLIFDEAEELIEKKKKV